MTIKVVQNIAPITSLGTTAAQSGSFSISSKTVRLVSNSSVFVEVGQNPTATTSSVYIPSGTVEVLQITRKESVPVVDVVAQNSTHTTISTQTFAASEAQHGFEVGDKVNIQGATDTEFNTSYSEVTDVNNNIIVIDYDSSGNAAPYDQTATLKYALKVSARTENDTGAGVFITEVQHIV